MEHEPYGNAWLQQVFARLLPDAGLAKREEQLAMANYVEAALLDGRHVLAEAGVGTGKSFAYLVPLVGHLLRQGGPVLIATHTIALQEQLVRESIPRLAELLEVPLDVVLAKGRHHYLCPERLAACRGDDPALVRLREWAAETTTGDEGELGGIPDALWQRVNWGRSGPCASRCRHAASCPSATYRAHYHDARGLIVTNHHQLFADLALRAQGHPIFPAPTALVLDEAHAIFDAARDSFGERVTLGGLEEAIAGVDVAFPAGDQGWRPLLDAAGAFKQALSACAADGEAIRPTPALVEAAMRLHQGGALVLDYLDGAGHHAARAADALRRALVPVSGLLSPDAVAWREGEALTAVPRELSGLLGTHLFGRGTPVVATSATLSIDGDFGYFKRGAGVEDPLQCQVGSPFDYGRQARLYLPTDLPDPREGEDAFYAAALERLEALLEATRGRALVLYTARERADEAYRKLTAWKRFPVYRQAHATAEVIERFKHDTRSVLLGTGFWEGLDVPGETLSCVVIVKLPFPAGDPVIAAREAAARKVHEDPFEAVLLPEMLIKLRQGAGRLIRGAGDRGVIAVLDPRAATREAYAAQVKAALPPAPVVEDLAGIRAFLEASR